MPLINFKQDMGSYAVGRRVNMEEWNTVTRTLAAGQSVGFGVPVVAAGVAHSVTSLTAAAQNITGITEATAVLPRPGDLYAEYDNVPVCQDGVIGVLLDKAVTRGAQARFNITTQKWTDAAASATVFTIPGAQFEEAGAINTVGVVRFRRPVPCLSA